MATCEDTEGKPTGTQHHSSHDSPTYQSTQQGVMDAPSREQTPGVMGDGCCVCIVYDLELLVNSK